MGPGQALFVEPFSGIAGDMFLGAMLSLGDPRFTLEDLRGLARAIVPGECTLDARVVWRGSLSGTLLDVRTPESARAPHRGWAECESLVRASPLSEAARNRAVAIFRRIAEAEARVHGTTPGEVHFHEVGAVDALVDICGAAFALERLDVRRVYSTPPIAGQGTVRCAHGEMPVPAPGTAEILRGLPFVLGGGSGERTTPTGAAILAELVERFGPPGAFVAAAIGYGAGHRDPADGPPNILRVQLGRTPPEAGARGREAWLLEVNLDDMTGEEVGYLLEALRAAGALDVWASALQMKKGRPGVLVSALARDEQRGALEEALRGHSTTLGLRWIRCERTEWERRSVEVEVLGERVRVKVRGTGAPATALDLSAEHGDLERLARASGKPLRELDQLARDAALRMLGA